jgi:hypothetical protein
MRPNPNRGRVYRRCGCRDEHGRQLGAGCPQLANPRHGSWAFAVDMPSPDSRRKTMRRSGYDTRSDARAALARVLECERAGVYLDDTQTVTDYLVDWLDAKARRLKPTTVARYRDYVRNDLLPAFGAVRLERLNHQHVDQFVRTQLTAGRGPVTVRRCIATLSSALNDAIRQRRLTHNAARYTAIPIPRRAERPCWTIEEAAAFLRYCHQVDDPLTELYELLICTHAQRRSSGPALGRRRPRRPAAVRQAHPRRRRQQPPGLQSAEDHRQPRLDRPVQPSRRRATPPGQTPPRRSPHRRSQPR